MEEQTPLAVVPRARAIRAIREWIQSGALAPGETLPSERALANRLNVGRATVRRALQVLQAEGLVIDRGGHVRSVAPATRPGQGLLCNTLAVIAPLTDAMREREQPGWPQYLALGAMGEARSAGLHVLTLNPSQLATEELEQLVVDRPMGIIICPLGDHGSDLMPVLDAAARAGIPLAVYGDSPELAAHDRVSSDHEAGAYELSRWLIAQGCRRILTLWNCSVNLNWVRARLSGYERALREGGLEPMAPIEMPVVQTSSDQQFEAATRMAAGYLAPHLTGPSPVDAIMAASDPEACAIAGACRILGKRPGEDVVLVGYDSYWLDTHARDGAVGFQATIDKRNLEIGRQLVRLLLDRIAGRLPREPQHRIVRPALVVLGQQAEVADSAKENAPQRADSPAAPVLVSILQKEREGASKPLFGWRMQGGRWTLGQKRPAGE